MQNKLKSFLLVYVKVGRIHKDKSVMSKILMSNGKYCFMSTKINLGFYEKWQKKAKRVLCRHDSP